MIRTLSSLSVAFGGGYAPTASECFARAESVYRVKRAAEKVERVLARYAKIVADEGCLGRTETRDGYRDYLRDVFREARGSGEDLEPLE
jgi:hypothetical protein